MALLELWNQLSRAEKDSLALVYGISSVGQPPEPIKEPKPKPKLVPKKKSVKKASKKRR